MRVIWQSEIDPYTDRDRESGSTVNAKASRVRRRDRGAGSVGTADGLSNRMDRLRCLGNAIVPQIAEIIGRAILSAEAA